MGTRIVANPPEILWQTTTTVNELLPSQVPAIAEKKPAPENFPVLLNPFFSDAEST
jgi:hypothetical protein